jgi:hypothetical protein
MAARVALVLRSAGEYKPEHVHTLAKEFDPCEVLIFTDHPPSHVIDSGDVVPLRHNWPGWWSKLELMRPDIEGDLLYLDLDTRIVGDLSDIRKIDYLTMRAEPYRPNDPRRFGSGVMYLPEAYRRLAWESWIRNPGYHMLRCVNGGDQQFLIETWTPPEIARWQDLLPGQLVSYKCDVRGRSVPSNARVVYFHGKPRPWDPKVTEL